MRKHQPLAIKCDCAANPTAKAEHETLMKIAETVAADQEPSPAQYVQHYQERAASLHHSLAEAQIELDQIEREQDAAIVCLMSLEVPP